MTDTITISHDTIVDRAEAVRRVRSLPPMERAVLALRLGLVGPPRSVFQIAFRLHVTPRRVRRLETLARCQIRHPSIGH